MAKSRVRSTGRTTSGSTPSDPGHALAEYRDKRDFGATPEPAPETKLPSARPTFVVQKHDATRLHYDVRLEIDGVMMSFAVPKGPSYDPRVKRFAVETEDHPVAYNEFEGRIPDGHYGAGDVLVWDAGTYETVPPGQERAMRAKGHLHVRLFGEKLKGEWHFVRMKKDREGNDVKKLWLFFKASDAHADEKRDIVAEAPASIVSGRLATRGPTRGGDKSPRELLEMLGDPMAATSGALDDPSQYSFEIKYDGYRILAAKSGSEVRLESRRGHDWTDRFLPVAEAVAALPARELVIDGEVCAVTADGRPSFQRLQQWVGGERREVSIAFAAFDLPWLDGRDLRARPIEERRQLLERLLDGRRGVVSFSRAIPPPPDAHGRPDVNALMEMARRAGLEGFVAKRKGSPWTSGRSPLWVKMKCIRRQEFAVVGYTPLSGTSARCVGALILAVRGKDGLLEYAGRVGTGFDDALRKSLAVELDRDRVDECPILLRERLKDARWSKPRRVAEVAFVEWSDDGKPRQPSFLGFRDDKSPYDCVREDERAPPDPPPPSSRRSVRLSNPDKVLYPRDGITKRDVWEYYEGIAPYMLPHLRGRPLTLQRWPDGIDGEEWYQQHPPQGTPPWVRVVEVEKKKHVVCDDVDTLRWLANLAALTLHPWSAHADPSDPASEERALLFPDYTIVDLDPGEGPWSHVIEVALAIRLLLEKLELPSVVKTTGKRGLHICIPFARGPSHADAVRLGEVIATAVGRVLPQIATIERSIPKRKGRLYVDYLQNGHGKTVAAPYTLRALDGAPVSTPLRWSEVGPSLDPSAFTLRTVLARVEAHGDLFAAALAGGPDVRTLLARLA